MNYSVQTMSAFTDFRGKSKGSNLENYFTKQAASCYVTQGIYELRICDYQNVDAIKHSQA